MIPTKSFRIFYPSPDGFVKWYTVTPHETEGLTQGRVGLWYLHARIEGDECYTYFELARILRWEFSSS